MMVAAMVVAPMAKVGELVVEKAVTTMMMMAATVMMVMMATVGSNYCGHGCHDNNELIVIMTVVVDASAITC